MEAEKKTTPLDSTAAAPPPPPPPQKQETEPKNIDVIPNTQIESDSPPDTNRMGSTRKSVHWSPELVSTDSQMNGSDSNPNPNPNPYVNYSASSDNDDSFSVKVKGTMDTVKDMLGRWGKRAAEATKKAEDLAGNTWQHLKTSPSFADAAMGRLAQGTKVLAEGGYEKIFRQTFETVPEEQLHSSYACYLSTSAGPVMGVLYVSSAKLAFCSDNPLSYKSDGQTEWSYYKVMLKAILTQVYYHFLEKSDQIIKSKILKIGVSFHDRIPNAKCSSSKANTKFNVSHNLESYSAYQVVIPLHQLKAVNPSTSRVNPAEKYIQVISVDNHEFWFMGFLSYVDAVSILQEALQVHSVQSV
ncbi:hypothetical protein ACFE04_016519 [Oxalis oulophora]